MSYFNVSSVVPYSNGANYAHPKPFSEIPKIAFAASPGK
jgi:hypothetical protein